MSDVHVLRRALRWDLTTPTFSSRAAVAEMKIRMDENTRIPEVISHWRSLTTGEYYQNKSVPFSRTIVMITIFYKKFQERRLVFSH